MTPAKKSDRVKLLPKSPTGIPGMDEITGGGLPKGRPTLVAGAAGCGEFVEHCGSHGSRLHKGTDGIHYSYAQWPDSLTREKAMLDVRLEIARLRMKEAILESFPEVILETIADHLELPTSAR